MPNIALKTPPSSTNKSRSAREVERRRAKRARSAAHLAALEHAQKIVALADASPDMQAASELYRVANNLRLRYARDENEQRRAVLRALEGASIVTAAEIVIATSLSRPIVQAILDDFASPRVELVFITTMGGKRNSGRNGTTLYYGLRR
jgi:hypothetical protein